MSDYHKVFRRHLPHIHAKGATYFITFRIRAGVLQPDERGVAMDRLKENDGTYYSSIAAVVMPDHVHAVLRPLGGFDLSRIMKGIRGTSARLINTHRNSRGQIWQHESYDRIIRNDDELLETLNYMLLNPVRAEICTDPWTYPWWYFSGL